VRWNDSMASTLASARDVMFMLGEGEGGEWS